ncbi:MAG: hypothetical protein JKY93_12795 [Gammaproteobacteria bacterium]|nr:hypothetical protein [Gammaproteobacteria bacterium]
MCLSSPSAPTPKQEVKPPAPAPKRLDEGVVDAGDRERRAAQKRKGVASTNKTGRHGLITPANIQKKTLLGG